MAERSDRKGGETRVENTANGESLEGRIGYRSAGRLPPSTRIVRSVAEWHEVDPIDLDQSLYEVIDGDLIDELFDGPTADGACRLSFVFCGVDVTIDSDGSITLCEP